MLGAFKSLPPLDKVRFAKWSIEWKGTLCTSVKTFSQSKQSKAMLKQWRLQNPIGCRLETNGNTHFATIPLSAMSLKQNLDPVCILCTNGQVKIKVNWI